MAASQPYQLQTQQVYMPTTQPGSSVRPGFASRTAKLLGVVQIFIGSASFVFQVIAILLHTHLSPVASGIWCGFMFIIAGSFGVASAKYKTNCLVITTLVLCVMTVVFFVLPMMFLTLADLAIHTHTQIFWNHYSQYEYSQELDDLMGAKVGILSCLLILAIGELVAAIWSAVVCCKAVCCVPGLSGGGAMYQVQYVAANGPQDVVVVAPPGGQPGDMYAVQPSTAVETTDMRRGIKEGNNSQVPNPQVPQNSAPEPGPAWEPPSTEDKAPLVL